MRLIPARTAVCTACDIECDLPVPRPPRNSQHHDRSGGGSCASRAAKTQSSAQSSYQLIGFLRSHLVDVPAQLVHAFNFTQKAISHGRHPFHDFTIDDAIFSASYVMDKRVTSPRSEGGGLKFWA